MDIINSAEIKALFKNARSIAIVGAKDKPGHPVDNVGRYLLAAGYKVFPVHPIRQSVWGIKAGKNLAELPEQADIINLFRAPEHCPAHADEVIKLPWKPLAFWMQLGIHSPEAADRLAGTGITIIEDRCIMVEHRALMETRL